VNEIGGASHERRSSERRIGSPRRVPYTQIGQWAAHPFAPLPCRLFPK
jgi:hypothetical protein